ncbi:MULTISPECIES: glutamine-hydrolyzing GMP synthase [unclassified Terriglobus]|uniref:glutamine-hydrolyzing GMP synthase n=1 Tax=unclassified Terriglobus TaxID=2628988 RepID=UPI003F98BD03
MDSQIAADAASTSTIVILDFGSQYTQLIARRIREFNVFSVVLPCTAPLSDVLALNPKGIILSGGPSSVYDADAPAADPKVLTTGMPILGICYGLQFITHHLGGKVHPADKREYGHARVQIASHNRLFAGLPQEINVWMSHGDSAVKLPEGFTQTAQTSSALASIANEEKRIWAVQFHPEVNHSEKGSELLRNFVIEICGAKPDWTPEHFIQSTIERVRAQVGPRGHAICGLSGGVDSSVAAVLVHKAIGDRLTCIFVNNGVLRKDEFAKVQATMREKLGLKVIAVDAGERFLSRLSGITDPEAKRKIIGNEFIAVFDDEAETILKDLETKGVAEHDAEGNEVAWLVQGTLYPDVIESSSVKGPSQTIKSHHNVGGLPENMKLKLIEPLRDLFKDEVRRIGRDLGMPEEILERQPFPGPGLAVRILGEITPDRVAILQEADAVVVEEIKAAGLYRQLWQSFAVLLPVKTVGVMGDQRTYAYTCAIRAVTSEDGMTADWAPLPYEVLKTISSRIVNEVRGINRVVYDITSKPPGTIEWE